MTIKCHSRLYVNRIFVQIDLKTTSHPAPMQTAVMHSTFVVMVLLLGLKILSA
jgi:hypothetical protein